MIIPAGWLTNTTQEGFIKAWTQKTCWPHVPPLQRVGSRWQSQQIRWMCAEVVSRELFLCVFQERRSGKRLTDWWSVRGFYQLICLEKTPSSSWSTCAAGSCPRPQSLSLDQMSKTISCNKLFPVQSKWAPSVEKPTSAHSSLCLKLE